MLPSPPLLNPVAATVTSQQFFSAAQSFSSSVLSLPLALPLPASVTTAAHTTSTMGAAASTSSSIPVLFVGAANGGREGLNEGPSTAVGDTLMQMQQAQPPSRTWSSVELNALRLAVAKHGSGHWNDVMNDDTFRIHVPGRTKKAIRDRYYKMADDNDA